MMRFKKIEIFLLLILLQFFLPLPLDATSSTATTDSIQESNATGSKIGRDKEMTAKLTRPKQLVSVGWRGGGVGGRGAGSHAFGGSHGRGGRGISNRGAGGAKGSSNVNRGPILIPFYAAGAMPHRQDNQHRSGSNQGSLNAADPPSLLLVLLLVVHLFNTLYS